MTYYKQVCAGYSKGTLMGNWWEERIYPPQPFRELAEKKTGPKTNEIACFNQDGIARTLPRIQRRVKWETAGRIVLNSSNQQGQNARQSLYKIDYPFGQAESSAQLVKRPINKQIKQINSTVSTPNSEYKTNIMQYSMANYNNSHQIFIHRQARLGAFNNKLEPLKKVKQTYETTYQKAYEKRFATVSSVSNPQNKESELNDIQTSLNMGSGIHTIHPKDVPNGYFRHLRNKITIK